ncbi:YbbR-like domain-containing protein [Aerococcaceae bacterium WGS1372]
MMNKGLMNSKWNVRLLSLVFAIFLYIFVASENNAFFYQSAANQQFASINVTETIDNVPVTVGPINENTFISGLPESVSVRITGPRNVINQVLESNITVQTEDLRDVVTGTQQIQFIIEDLPDSVDYQITPSRRYVKISQLETISSEIEYVVDPEAIASGYEVTNVTMNPTQVQLTGDVETVQQIDRVFVTISNSNPANSNFNATYHLQIMNAEGEVLDVNSNISEIQVQVEVSAVQSEVGMHVIPFGEDQAQFTYNYVITTPASLVVVGSQHENVETVGVVADVTGLTESATIRGTVQTPEGVEIRGGNDIQIEVTITPNQSTVEEEVDPESELESVQGEGISESNQVESNEVKDSASEDSVSSESENN